MCDLCLWIVFLADGAAVVSVGVPGLPTSVGGVRAACVMSSRLAFMKRVLLSRVCISRLSKGVMVAGGFECFWHV
jgi:hypothetical protein